MDKKKAEQFRKLLHKQKQDILLRIKRSMGENVSEDVRMSFELFHDNPDKSVHELNRYIDSAVLGSKSEVLDSIDEALKKIADGTYGICEDCGEKIAEKRLKAVPQAVCCVACQQKRDRQRKEKQYGASAEPVSYREDYLSEEE